MKKFGISRRGRLEAISIKNKEYMNRNWLYQKYEIEKLGAPEIARLCQCGDSVIYNWLNRFKIPRRNRSDAHFVTPVRNLTVAWLRKKYIDENLSCSDIAKISNCSRSSISRRLGKFGIPKKIIPKIQLKKSKIQKKSMSSKKMRKFLSNKMKKKWQDPEFREYMASVLKRRWNDPKCRADMIKKHYKKVRPTTPEKIFDEITPDNIKYVGNGSWWRKLPNGQYKNPDFKIKGQSKVIEIFGNYWHRKGTMYDNPSYLIELYKKVGIDCLIFWEREIHNNQSKVLEQTLRFI
ncbi:hypothetical protein AMJ44_14010 [candidate division WOR-1 bacterium DG_54_3]|uniref:Uncharacterized protein n=1 Tax=candidate division WOR-1 bacterium DG_54_3 TaxID=1703775 RepID=A0A0S7XMR3_UNCSA|nr:MAG: hypothetical protein AMJ44_14010 [candidate division WOR-1 bacterium DG_54_3]